jgi:DNA-binding MarR family transcriptional regulator
METGQECAGGDGRDERYEAAIRLCAAGILRMLWGEKMINKIFGRANQSHAAGLAIVMHFEALNGLGRRPTLALVQAQIGSSRTLSAFFALLRLVGFVRIEIDPADRRNQYLVPTEALVAGVRTWILHHIRCCEILGTVPSGHADALLADVEKFGAFMARSRRLVERARTPVPGGAAWSWFDRFDCGDRIALLLLREHYDRSRAEEPGPESWFALDSRDLADHLGISHSHVHNVINQAEEQGLLRQDRRHHLIALSPGIIGEIRTWFTSFWASVAAVAREAEAGWRDGAQTERPPLDTTGIGPASQSRSLPAA